MNLKQDEKPNDLMVENLKRKSATDITETDRPSLTMKRRPELEKTKQEPYKLSASVILVRCHSQCGVVVGVGLSTVLLSHKAPRDHESVTASQSSLYLSSCEMTIS